MVDFPISKGNLQSLVSTDHHYIKNGNGKEELYDWQADPWEQSDLSKTPRGLEKLAYFRNLLRTIVAA